MLQQFERKSRKKIVNFLFDFDEVVTHHGRLIQSNQIELSKKSCYDFNFVRSAKSTTMSKTVLNGTTVKKNIVTINDQAADDPGLHPSDEVLIKKHFYLFPIEDVRSYILSQTLLEDKKLFILPIIGGSEQNPTCNLMLVQGKFIDTATFGHAEYLGKEREISKNLVSDLIKLNIAISHNENSDVDLHLMLDYIKSKYLNRIDLFNPLSPNEIVYINQNFPEIINKEFNIPITKFTINAPIIIEVMNNRTLLINVISSQLKYLAWNNTHQSLISAHLLRKLYTGTIRYFDKDRNFIFNLSFYKYFKDKGKNESNKHSYFSMITWFVYHILKGLNGYIICKNGDIDIKRQVNLEQIHSLIHQNYVNNLIISNKEPCTSLEIFFIEFEKYITKNILEEDYVDLGIFGKYKLWNSELGNILLNHLEVIKKKLIKEWGRISIEPFTKDQSIKGIIENWKQKTPLEATLFVQKNATEWLSISKSSEPIDIPTNTQIASSLQSVSTNPTNLGVGLSFHDTVILLNSIQIGSKYSSETSKSLTLLNKKGKEIKSERNNNLNQPENLMDNSQNEDEVTVISKKSKRTSQVNSLNSSDSTLLHSENSNFALSDELGLSNETKVNTNPFDQFLSDVSTINSSSTFFHNKPNNNLTLTQQMNKSESKDSNLATVGDRNQSLEQSLASMKSEIIILKGQIETLTTKNTNLNEENLRLQSLGKLDTQSISRLTQTVKQHFIKILDIEILTLSKIEKIYFSAALQQQIDSIDIDEILADIRIIKEDKDVTLSEREVINLFNREELHICSGKPNLNPENPYKVCPILFIDENEITVYGSMRYNLLKKCPNNGFEQVKPVLKNEIRDYLTLSISKSTPQLNQLVEITDFDILDKILPLLKENKLHNYQLESEVVLGKQREITEKCKNLNEKFNSLKNDAQLSETFVYKK